MNTRFRQRTDTMAPSTNGCAVLHCDSDASHSVELFDFPLPSDPRYSTWTERTRRCSQWTPSANSKICCKHFRSVDILTIKVAGRTEKRLKYGAVPCVDDGLADSALPQVAPVSRADSPEIGYPVASTSAPLQTDPIPRPDSPEILAPEPKRKHIEPVSQAFVNVPSGAAADLVLPNPRTLLNEEARICCVPGCLNRRDQTPSMNLRFHAFPTSSRMEWEWTKRVRCSISWKPAPYSVVCSAHFSSPDYDLVSGSLTLKPTAIPRQLSCMAQFMVHRMDNPDASSRWCAICGCSRTIDQKQYKAAARLGFCRFPTDSTQREKWLAVCKDVIDETELSACENHFLVKDLVARFEEFGEEKFTVRDGVVPCRELSLWSDLHFSEVEVEDEVQIISTNRTIVTRSAAAKRAGTAEACGVTVENLRQKASGAAAKTGRLVIRRCDAQQPNTLPRQPPASSISVPRFLLVTNEPVVCCVPGCPITSLNTGTRDATLFPFISNVDPYCRTWVGRIRCAVTWLPTQSMAICSMHFEPSDIIYRDPVTRALLPCPVLATAAVPSRLSCIAKFHFSGLKNGETDVTGIQTCAVCHAKRKPDGCKPAEKLQFYPFPKDSTIRCRWMKFVENQSGSDTVTDTSLICENHFLLPLFDRSTNGDSILKRFAFPSRTFSLQPEFAKLPLPRPPIARPPETSTFVIGKRKTPETQVQRARCCVPGCKNGPGRKDEQGMKYFKFVKPEDPRYQLWLERVRPDTTWTPNGATKVCSDHFLPSQMKMRKDLARASTCFVLSSKALPSLLNGETKWEPAELLSVAGKEGHRLKKLTFDCCVAGCRNVKGSTVSEQVRYFRFVRSDDPRYDTWLHRARSNQKWFPDGSTKICSEHFLQSQVKYRKNGFCERKAILCRTALPSQLNGELKWEPPEMEWPKGTTVARDSELVDKTRLSSEECVESGTEKKALKRFACECCVPGCGNVKGINGSNSVVFCKFLTAADPRYGTWMRRLRYNAAWVPDSDTRICSDHFYRSEIIVTKSRRVVLSSAALPSQLLCMTSLSCLTLADTAPGQIVCAACGLGRLVVDRDLKSTEKLQFFPAPTGEIREKWIEFCKTQGNQGSDSALLDESTPWFLCGNHFQQEDFDHLLEGDSQRLKMDAVPSVKFSLEPDYMDPVLQINDISKPVLQIPKPSINSTRLKRGSIHNCVVPGCSMSNYSDESTENVTFHIFPSKLGGRFNEWTRRIRCAVSWDPRMYDRICSMHFVPEDFQGDTNSGKQRKTRCLKSTVVPTQLQCLETFRTPRSLELTSIEEIQTCCICSCWRTVVKSGRVQRSERLAFFPFPTDDGDRRDQWLRICRSYRSDFALLNGSLVCENHFHRDELISVYDNEKKVTRVVLNGTAVPSKINLPWLHMALKENCNGFLSCDNSDANNESMDVDGLDIMNDEWENEISLPLASSQTASYNGLPDDVDGEFSCSVLSVPDLPSVLPQSAEDDPRMDSSPRSPPPIAAENNALIFCAQCKAFLRTPCWLHVNSIPDEPVVPYSVASLPNALYMDVCHHSPTGKAVFAKDLLPRHTVFGPLIAPLSVEVDKNTRFWDVEVRQKHYQLDSDHASNWMKHVRFVDNIEDSNMLAFPRGAEIVFVTAKTIAPEEELKVSYSAQYLEIVNDARKGLVDRSVKTETIVTAPYSKDATPSYLPETSTLGSENGSFELPKDDVMLNNDILVDDLEEDLSTVDDLVEDLSTMDGLPDPEICVSLASAEPGPPLPEITNADFRTITEKDPPRKARTSAWRSNPSIYLNRNICVPCNMRFRREDMLELHKAGHNGSLETSIRPERQCAECRKEFVTFHDLLQHVDQHGTKLMNCPVCNLSCSITTVTIHTRKHHPEYKGKNVLYHRFICPDCEIRFPSDFLFRLHKYKHGVRECAESVHFPYSCPECGKVVHDLAALMQHVDEHSQLCQKCPVCEQWYVSLKDHMRNSHPEFPFQSVPPPKKRSLYASVTCSECGLRFPTEFLCKAHMSKHADQEYVKTIEFPHKCDECGQSCENVDSLVEHADIHGKQLRKCPVCDRWFGNLGGHRLREHPQYRQPSREMPRSATCTECGLRFPTDSLCRLHETKHRSDGSGEPLQFPRECPQCSETFNELGKLITHVDGYGKQTKKCPVCFEWFIDLITHLRRFHPEYTLTCVDCGMRFPTDELFELHKHQHEKNECTHKQNIPLSCPECGKWFEELDELFGHVNDHGVRMKKCPVCQQWYKHLRSHLRHSHPNHVSPSQSYGKRDLRSSISHTLTCSECGIRFVSDDLYQLHKNRHQRDECPEKKQIPLKCPQCSEAFESLDNLLCHADDHGQQLEKCPVCEQWCGHLSSHLRHSHPDGKSLPSMETTECAEKDRSIRRSVPNVVHSLTCQDCGLRFSTILLRQIHEVQHGKDEFVKCTQLPPQCPECDDEFEEWDQVAKHVDQHGKQMDKCPHCGRWFGSLKEHLRRDHPEDRPPMDLSARRKEVCHSLTCRECGLRFSTKSVLQFHEIKHGNNSCSENVELPQKCPECNETFEELDVLIEHIDGHGKQLDKCPVCGLWFGAMKNHMRRDHPDHQTNSMRVDPSARKKEAYHALTCRDCGLRFSTKSVLQFHEMKHDSNNGGEDVQLPQECPECAETFQELDDLIEHIDGHGKQLEKCPVCGLWFGAVRNHVRRDHPDHQDNPTPADLSASRKTAYHALTCRECGLRFSTKSILQIHEMKHGSDNCRENVDLPRECPECAETFEALDELIEHIDGHGRQFEKCPVCGLWFSALKEHRRRDHPDHCLTNPPSRKSVRLTDDILHSLTCDDCGIRFPTDVCLKLHQRKHGNDDSAQTEEISLKCPECDDSFDEVDGLVGHVDQHGQALEKCPICMKWYSHLKDHVRIQHSVQSGSHGTGSAAQFRHRNLICQECGLKFSRGMLCQIHEFKHGTNKFAESMQFPMECPECREMFEELDKLVEHVDRHGNQLEKCRICDRWLGSLDDHMRRNHSDNQLSVAERAAKKKDFYKDLYHSLNCRECGLRFTTKVLLELHAVRHGDDTSGESVELQKCPECAETFDTSDSLIDHVDQHGKQLSKCHVCGLWFGALREHIRSNHLEYFELQHADPISSPGNIHHKRACNECGLRFPSVGCCNLHKCKHGNDKFTESIEFPQKCPDCAEIFQELDGLADHVDEHGQSMDQCPVCGKGYLYLKTHLRTNHPEWKGQPALQSGVKDRHSRKFVKHYLTCQDCGLRFGKNFLCQIHEHKHGSTEFAENLQFPVECPECSETFHELDGFVKHMDQHGMQLEKCSFCDRWFGALNEHIRSEHKEQIPSQHVVKVSTANNIHSMLTCGDCGLRFPTIGLCRLHKYKHEEGDSMEFPQKCPECEEVFVELDGLVDHVDEHGQGLDKCPVCDKWYLHLKTHLRRDHPKSKTALKAKLSANSGKRFLFHYLTCGECGLRFPTNFLCQVHESQHGTSSLAESLQFPRNCSECIETFPDVGKLVEHVVVHGKQLEKCPVCDRWFGALSEHLLRYHPDHREVVSAELSGNDSAKKQLFCRVTCSDCGLRFATDFLCKLHRFKHGSTVYAESLRFPRKCPECMEEFTEVNAFVEHIQRYGRQLEHCPVCNRWFGALKEHLRRDHPEYRSVKSFDPARKSRYYSANGYYTCTQCGLRFTSDSLCQTHVSKHIDMQSGEMAILPQKCMECDRTYDRLVDHVDEHGYQTDQCPVCGRWLGNLIKHLRRFHPEYRSSSLHVSKKRVLPKERSLPVGTNGSVYVTCNECGMRFSTDFLCKLHGYKHNTEDIRESVQFPQKCGECDKIFTELDLLVEHVEEHGKPTKKCPVCNRWSSRLNNHLKSVHPDYHDSSMKQNGFHYLTCSTCGLRFATQFLRLLHDFRHGSTGGGENLTFPQKCPECRETFAERDEFLEHVDKHGKQMKQCPVCSRWFDQLRKHTRRDHLEYHQLRTITTGFTCSDCGIRFPTDITFRLHQVRHGREYGNKQLPQRCPECNETFEQLNELAEHVNEHGRRLDKCPLCDRWSTSLNDHMRRYHPCADKELMCSSAETWDTLSVRNRTCIECGLRFASQFLYQLHAYKHGNSEYSRKVQFPQKCPGCLEVFNDLDTLAEHVDRHGEELRKCPVCRQWFEGLVAHVRERHRPYYDRITSKPKHTENYKVTTESSFRHEPSVNGSELNSHMEHDEMDESVQQETHSLNTCVICHRHFPEPKELNQHIKEHEGSNGFTCSVCFGHFPFYRLLSRHVAVDHRPADAVTRHACTICESAFSEPADLEFHLFTHDAELQFKCDADNCGKRFISAKSLQGHVANVHRSPKRKRR